MISVVVQTGDDAVLVPMSTSLSGELRLRSM